MSSKINKSCDENLKICLDIIQHPSGSSLDGSCSFGVFTSQTETSEQTPGSSNSSIRDPTIDVPEKKLTLFALRLAILEKAASGLGALGFIWATVVLLGGFAVTLQAKDFWFVTAILLIEGTRIFSRSHELDWQHQATSWSSTAVTRNSIHVVISSSRVLVRIVKAIFRPLSVIRSNNDDLNKNAAVTASSESQQQVAIGGHHEIQRTWHSSEVPVLPYAGWIFLSKNVSLMLYWLQVLSAVACAAISLLRLVEQDYGEVSIDERRNRKAALDIFYVLALAEALFFLMEKVYWSWKIGYCKLMDEVCEECELGPSGIKRFFYDSYSSCIDGSIFDGLNMDLVSFAESLLHSDSRDEQLISARIFQKFATSDGFASYTLRKIGTSTPVIERLIEMLNWKNPAEAEIRKSAAQIVCKLAGKKQNIIRVAEIPGSMESISSLLYKMKPHVIGKMPSIVAERPPDYEFSVFNMLGLLILKKLAREHHNCWKIGNTGGLMPKIIDFTSVSEGLLRNAKTPDSQIKTVRKSLQLVKILASATGNTGVSLRKKISDNVFAVSNIREILQFGESHVALQKLGIEILASLAMDEEAKEKIGGTGGVITLLLSIFFQQREEEDQNLVSVEAGEALAVLAFNSNGNCRRILKVGAVVGRLICLLEDPVLQMNSSRILRNLLCVHSQPELSVHLKEVATAAPAVLKAIMVEKDKLLEVSLGLAAKILRFTTPEEFAVELERASIGDEAFAKRLVQILKNHNYPNIKVPRIRRFVIKVAIRLMKSQQSYIQLFKNSEAQEALMSVAETTSELECFNIFSGSVGQCRNKTTVSSLVDKALEFM